MCASEGKSPSCARANALICAGASHIGEPLSALALAFACSSVRPFFRFEAFSCWNSIEFMSNFYGAGLQKSH